MLNDHTHMSPPADPEDNNSNTSEKMTMRLYTGTILENGHLKTDFFYFPSLFDRDKYVPFFVSHATAFTAEAHL